VTHVLKIGLAIFYNDMKTKQEQIQRCLTLDRDR